MSQLSSATRASLQGSDEDRVAEIKCHRCGGISVITRGKREGAHDSDSKDIYYVEFQLFRDGESIPRVGVTQPLIVEFKDGQWLVKGDIAIGRGEMLNAAVLDWLAQRIGLHEEIIGSSRATPVSID